MEWTYRAELAARKLLRFYQQPWDVTSEEKEKQLTASLPTPPSIFRWYLQRNPDAPPLWLVPLGATEDDIRAQGLEKIAVYVPDALNRPLMIAWFRKKSAEKSGQKEN